MISILLHKAVLMVFIFLVKLQGWMFSIYIFAKLLNNIVYVKGFCKTLGI